MSHTYNIPENYKVEKGLPIDFLGEKIKDEKCKDIFIMQVENLVWKYHLVNDDAFEQPGPLTGKKGVCIFEVQLKEEVDPELMTEIIASFIPRRMILAFFAEKNYALASFIPGEYGLPPSVQTTKYMKYDENDPIEILDSTEDAHKEYQVIQRRIQGTIRERKREALIEQAFEKVKFRRKEKNKNTLDEFDILFSQANLDKIREDAEYVEEQLRVDL